jgi:hypothetical protein
MKAEKCYLVNCFEPARVSLKVNQRIETTANLGDANAVMSNEEIAASRDVSLDEQYLSLAK